MNLLDEQLSGKSTQLLQNPPFSLHQVNCSSTRLTTELIAESVKSRFFKRKLVTGKMGESNKFRIKMNGKYLKRLILNFNQLTPTDKDVHPELEAFSG